MTTRETNPITDVEGANIAFTTFIENNGLSNRNTWSVVEKSDKYFYIFFLQPNVPKVIYAQVGGKEVRFYSPR